MSEGRGQPGHDTFAETSVRQTLSEKRDGAPAKALWPSKETIAESHHRGTAYWKAMMRHGRAKVISKESGSSSAVLMQPTDVM